MSRCILHVGMHKTGTSSIQQSLNGFADESFVYANITGHPNHSRAVFETFDFKPRERDAPGSETGRKTNRAPPPGSSALARLSRSIDEARGRTWLVSGEGIALLPPGLLRRLHEFLRTRFDRVTAVAAVRAPAGYMASAFQEPVKKGTRGDLDLSRRYRSYRRIFAKFDDVFGRENVQLWKFDPGSFPGGCAVQDFCRRLGIALPAERIVRVNESLSREAMGLLFTYRKLGKDLGSMSMSGPQNAGLVEQLMKIGRTRFRFSPDVTRPILEKNRADIEWMEARLGQSLREELGEHQLGDVREESDLLNPEPERVRKLLALLGNAAPEGVMGETPDEVALLVHALREMGETQMKVADVLAHMQQTNPKLLNEVPQIPGPAPTRNVFEHMKQWLQRFRQSVRP